MELTLIKDKDIKNINCGSASFTLIMLLPHIGAWLSIYFWYSRGQLVDFISIYLITTILNIALALIALYSLNLKISVSFIMVSLAITLSIVIYYFFVYQCYTNANEWKIKQLVNEGYNLVNDDSESQLQLEIICAKQRPKLFLF
ncbi:MAG: hypothetical protein ACRC5R_01080 [Mycoplasmatales bacterium]